MEYLTKKMSIKDKYGHYHNVTKVFSSEDAFDKWFDKLLDSGSKVIGFF